MLIDGRHVRGNVLRLVSPDLTWIELVHDVVDIDFIELHDFVVELFRFVWCCTHFGSLSLNGFESMFAYQGSRTFVGDQMIRGSAGTISCFISIYLEGWLLDTFLLDAFFEFVSLRHVLHKLVSLRRIHTSYQSCNGSIGFLLVHNISLFCLTHISRLI